MFWHVGAERRGAVLPPLSTSDDGFRAPCVLCGNKLGGRGARSLPLQELAVGPAQGDVEATERHDAGLDYNCAALVLHEHCLKKLDDEAIEQLVKEMTMVPRADQQAKKAALS
jgi:hypothetical protein